MRLFRFLAAALLNKEITILDNCPQISDVYQMTDILAHLGCKVYQEKNTLIIDASEVNVNVIPGHYAKSVRGSILFMGALLARCGYVVMDFPGGCHIGKRPVDYHIDAFRKMGADISVEENRITCKSRGLKGCIMIIISECRCNRKCYTCRGICRRNNDNKKCSKRTGDNRIMPYAF